MFSDRSLGNPQAVVERYQYRTPTDRELQRKFSVDEINVGAHCPTVSVMAMFRQLRPPSVTCLQVPKTLSSGLKCLGASTSNRSGREDRSEMICLAPPLISVYERERGARVVRSNKSPCRGLFESVCRVLSDRHCG